MESVLNFFFSGIVKSAFQKELSSRLQLPVAVEKAKLNLHGCSFENLSIGQPPPFEGKLVEAKKVKLKHSWINLLFQYRVTLNILQIESPMLYVIKRGLLFGDTNLHKIPEIKPPRRDVTIEKLKLRNIKVKVSGPVTQVSYPLGSFTLKNINRNRLKEKYGQLWTQLYKSNLSVGQT